MWIFNRDGYFSIHNSKVSRKNVEIRARVKEDLENMRKKLGRSGSKVIHTPIADYPFRIDITRAEFSRYLTGEIALIDYDNFKYEIKDRMRGDILLDVWCATKRFEIENV